MVQTNGHVSQQLSEMHDGGNTGIWPCLTAIQEGAKAWTQTEPSEV